MNSQELKNAIEHHLKYSIGKDPRHAELYDWRMALSLAIRDRVVDPWFASTRATYAGQHKRVYYLSMEFLIGRLLEDAVLNLNLTAAARQAVSELGADFEELLHNEPDAALGNGGLGRLAACFLDSLSTIGCPAFGYGIRYEHGLFKQRFADGRQVEEPEDWLSQQHAWEFKRPESAYEIRFGGEVTERGSKAEWRGEDSVLATAYDTPIIGWKGRWANTLRLWSAGPTNVFDLDSFNQGNFTAAARLESSARTISRVLYPDDTTPDGKALRLKQEYLFTAASLRDILRRYESEYDDLSQLPSKVAIQLNDTHPAIAGPELVRLLVDERGMDFDVAASTARACLSYTNHTLLPEALERWPESLMRSLLPRHMQLIERIDEAHAKQHPSRRVSVLEDGEVGMGPLSFVMAHRTNGVSALHTELMKKTVFAELHRLHPERIVSQTNGVTPRRWLLGCNRPLADLALKTIGDGWVDDLEQLHELEHHVEDPGFRDAYAAAKRANKEVAATWLAADTGTTISPDALFDVQIKRFHEYKRQHLNILETIAHWLRIKDQPNGNWVPRVKIFAGKAAPGYDFAKEIIHLIHAVAAVVNKDPATKDLLQIVFPANYNVTLAERLIPAADLSEQISTAGKEASGTGNMKFALNGAMTIGTLDGANVEIRDRVGTENFFLFGATADQVVERRKEPDHAAKAIAASPALTDALAAIDTGTFSGGDEDCFRTITDNLRNSDYFMVCSDFAAYVEAQRRVDEAYQDSDAWTRKTALNTARSGWFSSDRTIRGYMKDVWQAESAYTSS